MEQRESSQSTARMIKHGDKEYPLIVNYQDAYNEFMKQREEGKKPCLICIARLGYIVTEDYFLPGRES